MPDESLPSELARRLPDGATPVAPLLNEERRATVMRAIATPDDTFDMDDLLDELDREDRS